MVIFHPEVQHRRIQSGWRSELLELGEHRRGRVPQLQPEQRHRRAGRRQTGHLLHTPVPEVGHSALAQLPDLGQRDP